MGLKNQSIDRQSHDALSAQRALRQILPTLKRAATSPEKFTERECSTIVELLEVALLADDPSVSVAAAKVAVAMVGENQRRDREERPTD